MRRLFTFLFITSASLKSIAQRNVDVLHYKHQIGLSDKSDTIEGASTITFYSTTGADKIEIDLHGINAEGKGMRVAEVIGRTDYMVKLNFSQINDKLLIYKSINKGDTIQLTILYSGIPADGLIISKNKFGKKTFFSDNWPNRAHHWIPCVDDPADKATVEFIVNAPSHYQVISNGIQIEETTLQDNKRLTHWKEDVPLPTKVMVIGVADFAVNYTGNVDCIPVSSWVFPENRSDGFGDYAIAKDVLKWYINYIGPYAYKKLANVQSKTMFGGMENASAIFYYENSVDGKRDEEALIAHEIVHQWFGNSATEKSFAHLWLSEGFATYLTHVYLESKYGTDSLNKRMQKDRKEVLAFVKESKKHVVDSSSDYMSLLNENSYQKGGWVLHMLRRELGDTIFKRAVKEYYASYSGKNAETKDLQKVFEKISGKNLEQFFRQWLHTGENPKLDIEWKYDKKVKTLLVTVKQLQQNIFSFPLEIGYPNSGTAIRKPEIKKLLISKRIETFSIPVKAESYLFQTGIDPYTSLLFEFSLKQYK